MLLPKGMFTVELRWRFILGALLWKGHGIGEWHFGSCMRLARRQGFPALPRAAMPEAALFGAGGPARSALVAARRFGRKLGQPSSLKLGRNFSRTSSNRFIRSIFPVPIGVWPRKLDLDRMLVALPQKNNGRPKQGGHCFELSHPSAIAKDEDGLDVPGGFQTGVDLVVVRIHLQGQ